MTATAGTATGRNIYAEPRVVTDLKGCWFYHTIDVPGFGVQEGEWDLRAGLDKYCAGFSFRGKRVLEIGTASGYLCFEMEKQGAEVIAVELPPGQLHDFVPRTQIADIDKFSRENLEGIEKMRKSFWLCHHAFKSRAKVVHASVYDLPPEIGPVDVATFGCILLHLRDPFLALANALRFTRETVVITMMLHQQPFEVPVMGYQRGPRILWPLKRWGRNAIRWAGKVLGHDSPPTESMLPSMVFLPGYTANHTTWWFLTPLAIQQFIEVLGFEKSEVSYHIQVFQKQRTPMFTVVGHRTRPMPRRLDGPYPWY